MTEQDFVKVSPGEPGPPGPQNLHLQSEQPTEAGPWLWLQPLAEGEFRLYYEDGADGS